MNMAHQSQLEKREYRNWVKAGLGLKYTKEGLEPFCDQLVKQQHVDILNKVKQKHNLTAVSCRLCNIKTLQPDHIRTRTRQCPLGQVNCNCQHSGGKIVCPNKVCGAIYDEIIQRHALTPPRPFWKNTNAQHWCTEPWALAKCFINVQGYETNMKASEFDCSSLLHVLCNNMNFQSHLKCTSDGSDLLQKVLQYRNNIYHSHDMELEDNDVTTYIDTMIAVLQDGKELINVEESKSAVVKLRELKRDDFVITTANEVEMRRAVMADIHELEETGKDISDQIENAGTKQKTDLEQKGKEVCDQVANVGATQKYDLEKKGKKVSDQIANVGAKLKTDLEQKGKEVREVSDQIANVGAKLKTDLEQKGKEVREVSDQIANVGAKLKTDLEQKGKEVSDQVANVGAKQKTYLKETGKEVSDQVANVGAKLKTDLEQKGKGVREVSDQIANVGAKLKTDLEQKGKEVSDQVANVGAKQKTYLKETGKEVSDQVANVGAKQKTALEKDGKEASDKVANVGATQKYDLEKKGKKVSDQIANVGAKLKTDLEQKGKEVREVSDQIANVGAKLKTDLEQKGKEVREVSDQIANVGAKLKTDLEQKGKEVSDQVANVGAKQKTYLKETGKEVSDQVANVGAKQKTALEKNGKEVSDHVANVGAKQKYDLEKKGKKVSDQVKSIGTKQKTGLKQKGKEVCDQVTGIGTKHKKKLKLETTKRKLEIKQAGLEVKDKVLDEKRKLEQKELEVMENITKEATKIKIELEQKQNESTASLGNYLINQLNVELEQKVKGYQRKGHNTDYDCKKTEYQKKLVQDYKQYAIQASILPLRPESNQTDIENVYVSPWMTVDIWVENSRQTQENPISMDEMFHNVEKPARNIYVLGDAGSGKTTLCKMLVYYWCVAHSERKVKAIEPTQCNSVKIMENYDFLFYVSLRHYSDLNKIAIMLDEIYPDPLLRTVLQNESDKCLILLDGLDEWKAQNQRTSQFLTPGLPTRDLHAKYTIITTTRRWKFDTLQIKDSEIDKKIKLKGIRQTAIEELTKTTVKILNETFHKNKVADDFLPALKKSPVEDVGHVPMILQQFICLWFDDKLKGTSKCAIYSSMLDLFFDWNALKVLKKEKVLFPLEPDIFPRLPEYLSVYEACFDNTNAIYHLSHLAYKTLFGGNKENRLTFSNSILQQLSIPGDVITCSLKVGILSEDQNINLFASRRQRTSFSFVHKLMQEFLAAVYFAILFESLDNLQNGDDFWSEHCKQFVRDHFGDCKTVADILEQSNIFIMLCGLESQLLPFISEFIYTITTADKQITEERKVTIDDYFRHKHVLQNDIQKCILSCVSEALSSGNKFKNSVYIADIVLHPTNDVRVVSYLHRQVFNLHNVLSVDIDLPYRSSNQDKEKMFSVLKLVTECNSLKTFKYSGNIDSSSTLSEAARTCIEGIEQQTVEIIARNKSTLKTVSFIYASERMARNLVQIIPTMCHVISVLVSNVTVSHEVCRSLCTILERSVNLQQLYLDITCNKHDEHSINLTKHKQLQYLDLRQGSIHARSVNTESLDTCRLKVSSSLGVCESLIKARSLKHMALYGRSTTLYSVARTETDCLVRLLPSLTSLSTVRLSWSTFTDNIITRPSDMRNLQEIELQYITMSMTTWCAFVDSLPALPQTVCVRTWDMTIEDSPLYIEGTRHMLGSGEAEREEAIEAVREEAIEAAREARETARQYIRRKPETFHVTLDSVLFVFLTKKTGL